MNKKIFGLALLAISMVSFSGMAQSTSSLPAPGAQQETVKGKKADKAGKKQRKGNFNPFEGINLSDSQKSQLEALKTQRQADKAAKKASGKEQNNTQAKADKQKNREERMAARQAAKQQRQEQVKSILTPEQYDIYLKNMSNKPAKKQGSKMAQCTKEKSCSGGKCQGQKKGGKKGGRKQGANKSAETTNKAS